MSSTCARTQPIAPPPLPVLSPFDAMEKRAAGILSRMLLYEQSIAGAGCRMSKRENGGMQDWALSVRWALARVGMAGTLALIFHLTRPFQDAEFPRVARDASRILESTGRPGITSKEAELIYLLSLEHFLRLLRARQIPDDYAAEAA